MRTSKLTASVLLVCGAVGATVAGCKSGESKPAPTTQVTISTPTGNMSSGIPATMPIMETPTTGPTTVPAPPQITGTNSREPEVSLPPAATAPAVDAAVPTTLPEVPTTLPTTEPVLPKPLAGMTHVLSMDEPFYKEKPTDNPKADDTLKAGTQVLVIVPGKPFSQVTTSDGRSGYTVTEGLTALGK